MPIAAIEHIDVDDRGVASIVGSRSKVIQIVMDVMAQGWSPEEIHENYPHLSLAAIHAALSYYYDHQAELDAKIAEDFREAELARERQGESPLVRRLRSEGRLR